jgi:hypothetical protein
METFILKIYRRNNPASQLVGTLQHINSERQFSFTTKKELYTLLTALVDTEQDDDADEAAATVPEDK